jgi:hypothetical protein
MMQFNRSVPLLTEEEEQIAFLLKPIVMTVPKNAPVKLPFGIVAYTADRKPAPAKQLTSGNRISNFITSVSEMGSLKRDWNGYDSEPPSQVARSSARGILLTATTLIIPNRVVASAQGGVGICFYKGDKYADIECLNTGEILAATSDGKGEPIVWEVAPNRVKEALERIGHFVNS